MSAGELVACPRCDGTKFLKEYSYYAEVGQIVESEDGTHQWNDFDTEYGDDVVWRCAKPGCEFPTSPDIDHFIGRLTMPDPAALLALRDRLNP